MAFKALVLFAFLAAAYAAPSEISHFSHELVTQSSTPSLFDIACKIVQTVISSKISAISIAVHLIEWAMSNMSIIMFGAIGAFGFCKLTDLCNFNYEEYVPVASLRSYATPERLESAERFLLTAIDKYAEKKKRDV